MGPFDRPVVRENLLPYRRPYEAPAGGEWPAVTGLLDDDPLAAARGAVNGVLWGVILWIVILWALL